MQIKIHYKLKNKKDDIRLRNIIFLINFNKIGI